MNDDFFVCHSLRNIQSNKRAGVSNFGDAISQYHLQAYILKTGLFGFFKCHSMTYVLDSLEVLHLLFYSLTVGPHLYHIFFICICVWMMVQLIIFLHTGSQKALLDRIGSL